MSVLSIRARKTETKYVLKKNIKYFKQIKKSELHDMFCEQCTLKYKVVRLIEKGMDFASNRVLQNKTLSPKISVPILLTKL